jgi:hypothetical protein
METEEITKLVDGIYKVTWTLHIEQESKNINLYRAIVRSTWNLLNIMKVVYLLHQFFRKVLVLIIHFWNLYSRCTYPWKRFILENCVLQQIINFLFLLSLLTTYSIYLPNICCIHFSHSSSVDFRKNMDNTYRKPQERSVILKISVLYEHYT